MKKLILLLVLVFCLVGCESEDYKYDVVVGGQLCVLTEKELDNFVKKPEYDGYYITTYGVKRDCDIVDESLSDYKVKVGRKVNGYWDWGVEGWLPKSRVHKYPTYQELLDDYMERHNKTKRRSQ